MAWQQTVIQYATQFGAIAIAIVSVGILSAIILAIAWVMHLAKQYDKHKVIVWQEYTDSNGHKVPMWLDIGEKGRLYHDKKLKRNFFHLKNAKVRMGEYESNNGVQELTETNLPRTPYLKGGEVVMVKKLDHKTYAFAQPIMFEGNIKAVCTQADMAEATASFDENIKNYGKQPNAILTIVLYFGFAVFVIIIIYLILQKVDILQQVIEASTKNNELLLEVARTLRGSAVSSAAPG